MIHVAAGTPGGISMISTTNFSGFRSKAKDAAHGSPTHIDMLKRKQGGGLQHMILWWTEFIVQFWVHTGALD